MKEMKVRLTFTEPVLGTASNNKDIQRDFIASKAPDAPTRDKKIAEEIEAVGEDEVVEQSKTVFPRDENGNPMLWDYQVRGFFKSAAQAGSYIGKEFKLVAYKKKIDLLVFVKERRIPLNLPEGGVIGEWQRPLRGQTAKGERISLANSETLPSGTWCEFTIQVKDDSVVKHVIQWLDYGKYNGIGQWRNSGAGRFVWQDIGDGWTEVPD